jgi:DNA processing protein
LNFKDSIMLKDWLKLHYINTLSLARKRAVVRHFGTPTAVFTADYRALRDCESLGNAEIKDILNAQDHLVQADLELLASLQCAFIGFTDPSFPDLLNEIPSPPFGLFCLGNRNLLKQPQISIVGSRNASRGGKKTTAAFAEALTTMGFTVTSGMAAGVDCHAHRGSLSAGNATIAVMGTGIDRVYPSANRVLYHEIAEKGLVVSEFAPGTPPRRSNFPQRNRIISGLSLGTLVVEAGIRSGSLITARLAAEQGREVFAVPGSIHLPTSRGCHQLIRQGAKLVESVTDIMEEIGQFFEAEHQVPSFEPRPHYSNTEHPVYNLIDYAPISIDQIIQLSGLTTERVSSILIDLELRGLIADVNGCYMRLP